MTSMLGHDLEIACTQFQVNLFRIDGEITEKHAQQIYQNYCVLDDIYVLIIVIAKIIQTNLTVLYCDSLNTNVRLFGF